MDIPAEFRRGGFDYGLVRAEWPFAIYSQTPAQGYRGIVLPDIGVVGYEVLTLRVGRPHPRAKNADTDANGEVLVFPSNEDFGRFGWSFEKFSDAVAKFEEIKAKRKEVKNG